VCSDPHLLAAQDQVDSSHPLCPSMLFVLDSSLMHDITKSASNWQKRLFCVPAAVLLLLLSTLPAQTIGPYRIAGTVVSSTDDSPLSRARVTLQDVHNRQKEIFLVTRDDGRFIFSNLPAGKYSLQGAKRGYITAAYNQHEQFSTAIVTAPELDTEHLTLRIPPAATLTGHVLDEAGDPVRRARVRLWFDDHSTGLSRTQRGRADLTDDQGFFEFTPLDPGTYFLSVAAQPWYAVHPPSTSSAESSSFGTPDRSLDVFYPVTFYAGATSLDDASPILLRAGDRTDLDLHLAPQPALHITLHASPLEEGKPPSFPVLTPQNRQDAALDGQQPNIQQTAPGVYEIVAAPGKYDVQLLSSNGSPTQTLSVDLDENTHELDLSSAQAMSTIHATIRAPDETALPPRTEIALRAERGRLEAFSVVNADNTVTFNNLRPGKYDVLAGSRDRAYTVVRMTVNNAPISGRSVTVSPGVSLELGLTLRDGAASVRGVTMRDGKPVSGAMVVLAPANPETHREWFRRDQSDFDGTFTLPSVLPGNYTVLAIDDGWDLNWSKPAILHRYLSHGQKLTVPDNVTAPLQLPAPIEIQSK